MINLNFYQKLILATSVFTTIVSPFHALENLSAQPTILSQSSTNSEYATIQGELTYPSDYTPAQKVCAEDIFTKKSYCTRTRQEQRSYKLQLPPGVYHVFALACSESYGEYIVCQDGYREKRAYYTDHVICGITAECGEVTTGNPIPVKVEPGENLSEINPQDWYSQ